MISIFVTVVVCDLETQFCFLHVKSDYLLSSQILLHISPLNEACVKSLDYSTVCSFLLYSVEDCGSGSKREIGSLFGCPVN